MRIRSLSLLALVLATVAIFGSLATVADAKKARHCGSLRVPSGDLAGTYSVVSPASRMRCKTARSVLRKAVRQGADFGETLPSSSGRVCLATLRPEYGSRSRRVVACGPENPEHSGSIRRIDASLNYG